MRYSKNTTHPGENQSARSKFSTMLRRAWGMSKASFIRLSIHPETLDITSLFRMLVGSLGALNPLELATPPLLGTSGSGGTGVVRIRPRSLKLRPPLTFSARAQRHELVYSVSKWRSERTLAVKPDVSNYHGFGMTYLGILRIGILDQLPVLVRTLKYHSKFTLNKNLNQAKTFWEREKPKSKNRKSSW